MPAWKVLLVGLQLCACLALATAAFVVPFNYTGGERWLWAAGLAAATLAMGGLLAFFLRHAGRAMDVRPRWDQR